MRGRIPTTALSDSDPNCTSLSLSGIVDAGKSKLTADQFDQAMAKLSAAHADTFHWSDGNLVIKETGERAILEFVEASGNQSKIRSAAVMQLLRHDPSEGEG